MPIYKMGHIYLDKTVASSIIRNSIDEIIIVARCLLVTYYDRNGFDGTIGGDGGKQRNQLNNRD